MPRITYTCYTMGDNIDPSKMARCDVTYEDSSLDVRTVEVVNDTSGVATFTAKRESDGATFTLTAQPTSTARQNVQPGVFTLQLLDGVDPWPGPGISMSMSIVRVS